MVLQSKIPTHFVWADDFWLWADSLESLNAMLQDVAEAAYREIGLVIRWDKCSFAKVGDGGASAQMRPRTQIDK